MKINMELTNLEIRGLIVKELMKRVKSKSVKPEDVSILVKSKQNYRNFEWERGEIKASLEVTEDPDPMFGDDSDAFWGGPVV